MKCLPDTTHWTKAFPLILLGIRTAIKQDCRCTAAELVYGTTLRLPGEFFTTTSTPNLDPNSYATQLKTFMQMLQPPTVRNHTQRTSYINKDLSSCPFVFVRHDAVKKPLQAPYDGPFKVLQRTDKHITLEISGKKKVVSLDHLKPAYMDTSPVPDTLSQTLTACTVTFTYIYTTAPSPSIITITYYYYSHHQVRPTCSLA